MVLVEFSRYTSDFVGLEKFLRLIQGLLQLLISNPLHSPLLTLYAITWAPIALKHCAITRRAFRYFKFIDFGVLAGGKVKEVVFGGGSGEDYVLGGLEAGKAGCMMVYLGLEAFTILHALGILTSSWGSKVFFEAMKFWFYAISCSVLSLSYQLLVLREDEKKIETTDEKKVKKVVKKKASMSRKVLLWQLVGASCDLMTPGAFVGWLDVSPATVAVTSILSSVLSSIEIWKRVNRR